MSQEPKRFLSLNEAAEYLGIHRTTIMRIGKDSLKPDAVIGDRKGYTEETLSQWWKEHKPERGQRAHRNFRSGE